MPGNGIRADAEALKLARRRDIPAGTTALTIIGRCGCCSIDRGATAVGTLAPPVTATMVGGAERAMGAGLGAMATKGFICWWGKGVGATALGAGKICGLPCMTLKKLMSCGRLSFSAITFAVLLPRRISLSASSSSTNLNLLSLYFLKASAGLHINTSFALIRRFGPGSPRRTMSIKFCLTGGFM